ncbi:MAG: choice-of-anchor tandem repeat NxxGxxAF-containing protein [Kiritimatiellia bacterium]
MSSIDYGSSDIPVFSDLGRVAFLGTVTGTGITAGVNDKILYTAGGGSLQQVARKGDQPGRPRRRTNTLSIPDSYSPTGCSPFRADMSTGSGGAVTATKYGIWSGTPAALALTWAGDAVDLSYTYSVPDIRQSLNAAGSICFVHAQRMSGTGRGWCRWAAQFSITARLAGRRHRRASFANDPSTCRRGQLPVCHGLQRRRRLRGAGGRHRGHHRQHLGAVRVFRRQSPPSCARASNCRRERSRPM